MFLSEYVLIREDKDAMKTVKARKGTASTRIPKPETRNPKPETRTRNPTPTPETQNPPRLPVCFTHPPGTTPAECSLQIRLLTLLAGECGMLYPWPDPPSPLLRTVFRWKGGAGPDVLCRATENRGPVFRSNSFLMRKQVAPISRGEMTCCEFLEARLLRRNTGLRFSVQG